ERCLAKDPRQRPTPGDLLAELGAGELAADWLPPRLTEVVSRYASPGLAAAASLGTGSPLPAGIPGDASPPAGISARRPATTAARRPGGAGREPPAAAGPAGRSDGAGPGGRRQRTRRQRDRHRHGRTLAAQKPTAAGLGRGSGRRDCRGVRLDRTGRELTRRT